MEQRRTAKHYLLLSLLALQVVATACTLPSTRKEALRTIATADSLDNTHQLYSDTVALRLAIRALNKPISRDIHRNALASAYYYMGRNLSNANAITEATDCYIACDRLHPDDLILRGRVNACMADICSQQQADSLALFFNNRSTKAFQESGNIWYYAYGLLFLSENYSNLKMFNTADSLWYQAQEFQIDDAYRICLLEKRGSYFYKQQQYDSALTYFSQIANSSTNVENRCYYYLRIMQSYTHLNKEQLAYPYAEYIVGHSQTPNFCKNAYYTLISKARKENNTDLMAIYAYKRQDYNELLSTQRESTARAVVQLQNYILHPYPFRTRNIIIIGCLFLCSLLLIIFCLYYKQKTHELSQVSGQLILLQTHLKDSQRLQQEDFEQRRQAVETIVLNISDLFEFSAPIWKDYNALCHVANQNLYNVVLRLQQSYHLNQQDILICLLTLYQAPAKVIADKINRSVSSIPKLKSITAKTIGTTTPQLREFLISFMAK